MSIYYERLSRLKKDIAVIKSKKSKKFTKDQQIMIDFINAVTPKAEFSVKDIKIVLRHGDEKKGFKHILIAHYCKGCRGELTAMDILNMTDIIKRGIKLATEGVSNSNLVVYQKIKGFNHYKLVLKPTDDKSFVITMYSVG